MPTALQRNLFRRAHTTRLQATLCRLRMETMFHPPRRAPFAPFAEAPDRRVRRLALEAACGGKPGTP
jgi:hypothetical protein